MSSQPATDPIPTQDELDLLHYQPRIERPIKRKLSELQRNERLHHVIFSGQFSVDMLEDLAGTADKIRVLSKNRTGQDFLINLLHHKRAMDALLHAALDPHVPLVHGRLPNFGDHLQRGARPDYVFRDEGRDAIRFLADVQQLLRFDHHAQQVGQAGRVVCVFDERPRGVWQP